MRSKIATDRARFRRYHSMEAVVSTGEDTGISALQRPTPNSQLPIPKSQAPQLGSWELGVYATRRLPRAGFLTLDAAAFRGDPADLLPSSDRAASCRARRGCSRARTRSPPS